MHSLPVDQNEILQARIWMWCLLQPVVLAVVIWLAKNVLLTCLYHCMRCEGTPWKYHVQCHLHPAGHSMRYDNRSRCGVTDILLTIAWGLVLRLPCCVTLSSITYILLVVWWASCRNKKHSIILTLCELWDWVNCMPENCGTFLTSYWLWHICNDAASKVM